MGEYFELKKRALLMGANVFWLPSGLGRDSVLAAYQFKGVSSEIFALQDISGGGKPLVKYSQTYNNVTYTPIWNSASGFTFAAVYGGLCGYLDSESLDKSGIKSAVICFSGVDQNNRAYLMTAGGASGKAQIYAATSAYIVGDGYTNYAGPGFCSVAYSSYSVVGQMKYYGSTYKQSGVIGVNFETNQMYIDGTDVTSNLSSTPSGDTYTDFNDGGLQGKTFGNSHTGKSALNNAVHAGKTIIAAAFFDVELSAAQHQEIATAMLAL